jgi:TolA-binding protein
MRGRWASFAIGSAVARNRTQNAMQQQQAQAMQQQQAQQQYEAQQLEIERLKAQQGQQNQNVQSSNSQEDVTQKIQKLGELHQKGLLTDEEFSKLKMDLLSKL